MYHCYVPSLTKECWSANSDMALTLKENSCSSCWNWNESWRSSKAKNGVLIERSLCSCWTMLVFIWLIKWKISLTFEAFRQSLYHPTLQYLTPLSEHLTLLSETLQTATSWIGKESILLFRAHSHIALRFLWEQDEWRLKWVVDGVLL